METKIKEIHSPHPDVAKDEVLELQYAVTELKVLVVKLVLNGESLESIKSQAIDVINKCIARLGPVLGAQHVQRTLLNTFNSDYHMLSNNMKVINEHYSKKVPGYAIDPLNPDATVSDQSIRNFWTDQKRGAAVIKDYRKEVNNQLKLISATAPIVALNDKDGNHYKMSARNYAEMTVRHQANLDDIKNLKEEGVDLVWTSSHVDASKRCEPYQGKLYSISGKTGTTKDGIPYKSLDDALLGPKGDGNGIINGYNCRHYLIPYVPGSTAPIEYDKKEIAEERKVNERQRQYENQIRQLKLQQKLAKESGNDELAKRLSKRWHKLDLNYQAFSLENGRQFYRWRTVVGREENIEPNKWGEQQAEKLQSKINVDAKELESKYIYKEDNMYKCKFQSKEEIQIYLSGSNIKFSNTKIDSTSLEVLNDKISAIKNLEENCKDVKVPDILIETLGLKKDSKFVFIKPTEKRQGTYIHIADDGHQEMGNDPRRLKSLSEDIKNPQDLHAWTTINNRGNIRCILCYNFDETKVMKIVSDMNGNGDLEIVTALTPSNKIIQKHDKKDCKII